MRLQHWALCVLIIVVGLASSGCAGRSASLVGTPAPAKTLRPTFTNTPIQPARALPTATPVAPPPATLAPPSPEPPTAAPSPTAPPTPEPATLTVSNTTVNVRSGPGTNYARIGQVSRGQSFTITGKNASGDWWQFEYNGQSAWVFGEMVTAQRSQEVTVAANIPAPPPTPRPQPTARPQPAQPTKPPAPSYQFGAGMPETRPNTNPYLTVWCRVMDRTRTGYLPGTIRIVRSGSSAAPDRSFDAVANQGDPGLTSEFIYNQGCKVEMPDSPGTYTAYLVNGDTQISEPINFTAAGDTRIFIMAWTQK